MLMYRTCNSMNNLSSYFELVDARISASVKEIYLCPVSAHSTVQRFMHMTHKYFVYDYILSQPLKVLIPPMMHSLIQLSQLRVFRSQTQKLDS